MCMTDTNKLKGRIYEKGLNLSQFAHRLGITPPALRYKLRGDRYFTVPEILLAMEVLGIDKADIGTYFFTLNVSHEATHNEIH